jgi:hypothetical protein
MYMKTEAVLAVGVALILGLSIAPYMMIHNASGDLASSLDSVQQNITQGQWDKAKEQISSTHDSWTKTKRTWSSIIDHQEIDNIDISMSRLEQYVETKALSLSAGEVSTLKQLVEHIADKEKPTLHNVF